MVLESLLDPYDAEQHPAWLILHGALYALLGLAIGLIFFKKYASMVSVFFIAAASIPLLYKLISYEEDKDYHELEEKVLIKEHGKAVNAYFMLFIGATLAFAAAFIFLPSDLIQNSFQAQIETLGDINPHNTITGQVTGGEFFTSILANNMRVLLYCVVFSLMYGAGAIFILAWNASVLGLAIGNTIKVKATEFVGHGIAGPVLAYTGLSLKTILLRYGIHGSLEILGYMAAGLAGGIISVAVIKHHFKTKKFEHVLMDSVDLIIVAALLIALAAVVETWVTPLFYL